MCDVYSTNLAMKSESWYARLTMRFVFSFSAAADLEMASAISELQVAGGS